MKSLMSHSVKLNKGKKEVYTFLILTKVLNFFITHIGRGVVALMAPAKEGECFFKLCPFHLLPLALIVDMCFQVLASCETKLLTLFGYKKYEFTELYMNIL